jgi:hypothetical protein
LSSDIGGNALDVVIKNLTVSNIYSPNAKKYVFRVIYINFMVLIFLEEVLYTTAK